MSCVYTTSLKVLEILNEAPAFVSDIASEMEVSPDTADTLLRRLHSNKDVVRRRFYVTKKRTRWLYMLPKHAELITTTRSKS